MAMTETTWWAQAPVVDVTPDKRVGWRRLHRGVALLAALVWVWRLVTVVALVGAVAGVNAAGGLSGLVPGAGVACARSRWSVESCRNLTAVTVRLSRPAGQSTALR